ncbi:MAG: response regulator transcription factor [Hyphomicrobiales bacterium]|nr:MAG: response regulator transcription factor [Hyphomicrobiales bacterium]
MVRIVVADEHAIYRMGLRVILQAALPGVEFLEAADLGGLMRHLMEEQPIDLALVSLNLTPPTDMQLIGSLKRAAPMTRYVALATDGTFDQVLHFVAEGFQGFISKLQGDNEIVQSISDVLAGRLAVPRALTPSGAPTENRSSRGQQHRRIPQQNPFGLTPRQSEVLALLADGLSNREIAQILHIAEPTTKIHVSALMRALNVRNRTEAAVLARDVVRSFEKDSEGANNSDQHKAPPRR